MTTAQQPTKTYGAIYVTIGKNGKARFHRFAGMRLWSVSREIAEASFAAGATIYRKQAGTSIWAEGSVEVVG